MPKVRKGWIPKSQRAFEQYYRDVADTVGGASGTLSDEEQKSAIPFLGMLQDIRRQVLELQREAQKVQRLEMEVKGLKKRMKNVEGEL